MQMMGYFTITGAGFLNHHQLSMRDEKRCLDCFFFPQTIFLKTALPNCLGFFLCVRFFCSNPRWGGTYVWKNFQMPCDFWVAVSLTLGGHHQKILAKGIFPPNPAWFVSSKSSWEVFWEFYDSKVVSTHLWNTPLNLYQQTIMGFLS